MNLPLSKLSPRQSLGYIEAGQSLECISNVAGEDSLFPLRGVVFEAGRSYKVRSFEIAVRRTVQRPSHSGEMHEHSLNAKDAAFAITDGAGRELIFVEQRHCVDGVNISQILNGSKVKINPHFSFATLLGKFKVPSPVSVAEANPQHLEYNLKFLDYFEQVVNQQMTARKPGVCSGRNCRP